jgi:hypothetical protein
MKSMETPMPPAAIFAAWDWLVGRIGLDWIGFYVPDLG